MGKASGGFGEAAVESQAHCAKKEEKNERAIKAQASLPAFFGHWSTFLLLFRVVKAIDAWLEGVGDAAALGW
jgi:hypothetical protein